MPGQRNDAMDEALRRYAAGENAASIAADLGLSKHSIRARASELGIKWGSAAGERPLEGVWTRRCRNIRCINRFVPVNDHHFFCSPECRDAPELWTIEEILAEEGSLAPGAAPNEMAKRAFGQKAQLVRRVNQLTSLRDYLRFLVREMAEEGLEVSLPPIQPPKAARTGVRSAREVLLFVSDWQLGKLEQGIGVECMVEQRVPRIIEATVQIVEHFRASGHPVERVHVVAGGDMIEGCFIYGGQNVTGLDRTSNTHRLVKQIMLAAELLARLAMALAGVVQEVVVHSVPGNHGRPNGRNDFADPEDNFDTLAAYWARDKAARQENVVWDIHENWWGRWQVLGHEVVAIHGDQWRGKLGKLETLLPQWVLANTFGCRPDLFLTAHRHEFVTMEVNGVPVVQNGTIDGGSSWYLKAYGRASRPIQTVVVVSERRVTEAIYPIFF